MEVRRQIILCYIIGCCVINIYTKGTDLDRNNSSTTLPSEESTDMTELKTGNLRGYMTLRKNGAKLKLKINSNVFWDVGKSMDSETCKGAVNLKGEKGDKGADAIQAAKGEKGEKGYKGDSGPPGIQGTKGESGSNGTDGQKGKKGEDGLYKDLPTDDYDYGKKKAETYGVSIKNPAYSCKDFEEDGIYYLNRASGFKVSCEEYKSCFVPKETNKNHIRNIIKNTKVWLSSYKLDLVQLYNFRISELSYLMIKTESFQLSLRYSSELKILEILCWNGVRMKMSPNFDLHGCKGSTNEEGTGLDLECTPANYLPMDFLVEVETETVSIELKKLCFT